MRILLLTDGSDRSLEAARWLASYAARLRETPVIHLLHVHPPLPYPIATEVVGRVAVENYQREESERALAPAAAMLRDAGLAPKESWMVGEAAHAIAGYVDKNGFDLVVMGTHGHGAMLNLALGSIATKCIAALGVPVLVVPARR